VLIGVAEHVEQFDLEQAGGGSIEIDGACDLDLLALGDNVLVSPPIWMRSHSRVISWALWRACLRDSWLLRARLSVKSFDGA